MSQNSFTVQLYKLSYTNALLYEFTIQSFTCLLYRASHVYHGGQYTFTMEGITIGTKLTTQLYNVFSVGYHTSTIEGITTPVTI